jgi:hypothetical protein
MTFSYLFLLPAVPYVALLMTGPEPRPLAGPLAPSREIEAFDPTALPGASGGPDAGGPDSPLSARAIREAARGWEWKHLEVPGWKLLMTPHAVIRGDAPLETLRAAGAYVEVFHGLLARSIGGDSEGLMFSVRVFADELDFRRYAGRLGAANAESLYDPRGAEIVVCPDPARGRPWLQKTLAHEFTHAWMDRVWRRTEPLWFCEGMAEYFSNFEVREGRLWPGTSDRRAELLLRLNPPVPLADFLKLGREEMYGPGYAAHYAQAWSFVRYLMSWADGTVDLLLRGQPLREVEELEKGWRAWMER